MVFQRLALFPHYSVFDNVAFGLRMRRLPAPEVGRRVAEALSRVELGDLGARRIGELSGGQQQRVALARALVNEPRVLLLDEPLSALDLKLRIQLQEELKRLQRSLGTTFIYVTHDQGEALAMSDRIGVMAGGRLEQVGTPLEIYERPATRFVAGFIGDANLVEAVVEGVDGDCLVARAGDARVRARRQGWERVGAPLTVCVRPERLRVTPPDARSDGLAGRVEDRAFSGSLVKYRLAVPGLRLHAAIPYAYGTPLFEVGDQVAVTWDGDQAVTVPG
jgi:ABC-type Fe3+/spermidine/putrescine transport system ATPase subunit